MFVRIYNRFASLNLGLWLTFGVLFFLGVGSFVNGGEEGGAINDMPLLAWLRLAPPAVSWWLWVTLVLLALLVVNTLLCSVESLRMKWQRGSFLIRIAPQVMHAGFLLIVLAHLFSARGSFKEPVQVTEGMTIGFPDGSGVRVEKITAVMGMRGMVTDYEARVRSVGTAEERTAILRPNHPFFHQGFGLYLKQAEPYPVPNAYLEVHREPGAGIALAGALLFTLGNVVLLAVRRGR
ncbi:MAG TPA: cytochrome c biogenesis protein ResB [Geobacteraceae bacterium]